MWLGPALKGASRERGQVLFLFVGAVTVILLIAAIVIDFGLWFSERRDIQRAADFAALAGAQDLLNYETAAVSDNAAMDSAYEWAGENGFVNGEGGVVVEVELVCRNDLPSPPPGICYNPSAPGASDCDPGDGCDALSVKITKPADRLFTQLFGIGEIEVTSGAAAVAGLDLDVQQIDAVIARDVSGSMLSGCNSQRNNAGCPLKESRDASHDFVDILTDADGSSSQVGYIPYNYCYKPPGGFRCIPETRVVPLTTDAGILDAGIDQPDDLTFYTNICLPLLRANQMFAGPPAQSGAGVVRTVLLLTDGDQNPPTGITDLGGGLPPLACRPSGSTPPPLVRCGPAWEGDRSLDVKMYQQAQALAGQGVEIYVVGLDVCGTDDGRTRDDLGYCAGIGDNAHDNIANQRLLKCVASTPEHYLPVAAASELPPIFRLVAARIVGRGLLR